MRIRALALLLPLAACGNTSSSTSTGSTTGARTSSATGDTTGSVTTGGGTSGSGTTGGASTSTGTSGGTTARGTSGGSTGSTDAGTSSSSGGTSGGTSGGIGGAPITATAQQWTWIPFPNAFCGNATPTGLGVNLNPGSTQVIIYLEGGGACYDDLTCYTLQTAANFGTGYGPANFQLDATDPTYLAEPGGFFDRTTSANPFQNYSYVYVPYCTGDVHAGNNIVQLATGPANFVGFANLTAFLERLVPTFPSATQVVLAGSSAGGFGAFYNWWHVQQAFGAIPVIDIDDSGTFLPSSVVPGGGVDTTQATAWGTAATTPPGCTGCSADYDALYDFYAQIFPNQRGALLSYAMDDVLPTFYGITQTQFDTGLAQELSTHIAPNPSLGYFVTAGAGHVLWFTPQLTANGVTLQSWVGSMVTGGAWTSEQ